MTKPKKLIVEDEVCLMANVTLLPKKFHAACSLYKKDVFAILPVSCDDRDSLPLELVGYFLTIGKVVKVNDNTINTIEAFDDYVSPYFDPVIKYESKDNYSYGCSCSSDYSTEAGLWASRFETDKEYESRLEADRRNKEIAAKAKETKKANDKLKREEKKRQEREEYERLKKKFEK